MKRYQQYVLWVACFGIIFFFIRVPLAQNSVALSEDITLAIHPSVEEYITYGDRHFDARSPIFYNIDRAEYMYEAAWHLSSTTPFVNHELARIAFLRGDFPTAMWYIDKEIALPGGPQSPSSYYILGLIEGYDGKYADSAKDYEKYLSYDPNNWAAVNDYSWVLLKANRPTEAAQATARGLTFFPDNPWLLNSNATALYEMGDVTHARAQITKASEAVGKVTREEWLHAYPGNDPAIADQGIASFKKSVQDNIHSMRASSTPIHQK